MSKFRTISNPTRWGTDCVVRVTPDIRMDGLTLSVNGNKARSTDRKVWGKRKADRIEMQYASRLDRKEERRVEQRLDRKAKRQAKRMG
jgi:hypothetical protein